METYTQKENRRRAGSFTRAMLGEWKTLRTTARSTATLTADKKRSGQFEKQTTINSLPIYSTITVRHQSELISPTPSSTRAIGCAHWESSPRMLSGHVLSISHASLIDRMQNSLFRDCRCTQWLSLRPVEDRKMWTSQCEAWKREL